MFSGFKSARERERESAELPVNHGGAVVWRTSIDVALGVDVLEHQNYFRRIELDLLLCAPITHEISIMTRRRRAQRIRYSCSSTSATYR